MSKTEIAKRYTLFVISLFFAAVHRSGNVDRVVNSCEYISGACCNGSNWNRYS